MAEERAEMPEIALLDAFAVVEARLLVADLGRVRAFWVVVIIDKELATTFAPSIALLATVLNEFVISLTSDRTLPEIPEVVRLLVGSLFLARLRPEAFSLVVVLEISSVRGKVRGAPPLGRA